MTKERHKFLTFFRNALKQWINFWVIEDAEKCGTQNQVDRERWLKHILANVPEGYRILDAGAGELQYKKFCRHLEYVSQDFAQYNGKGDGSSLQKNRWDQSQLDIVSDITKIPEPDAYFDAVMCIEVLEHLPEPILALAELNRLLRPDGILIITAPFCSLTHYSPYHYYSGFNRYFYEKHLTEMGFEILELDENGNFFEYLAQEIHRVTSIAKRYCHDSPMKIETLAMQIMIKMLMRFSNSDFGSNELLCFGYHVLAKKIN